MKAAQSAILLIMLSAVGAVAQTASKGDQQASSSQSEPGAVCVLPNSADPPTRISPGGEYNPATLTLRIDKQQPVPWPHKKPVKIENLARNERHLVVLTSDGKRIQSFWFQFSDFKNNKLCIYFDGYEGVQLGDRHSASWCRCK